MQNQTNAEGNHIYEVGMMSDTRQISAPSAGAAAMYYGLYLVDTNNPFMTAVFKEDGNDWSGDAFWMNLSPDEEHVKMVAGRIKHELEACQVIKGDEENTVSDLAFETWDDVITAANADDQPIATSAHKRPLIWEFEKRGAHVRLPVDYHGYTDFPALLDRKGTCYILIRGAITVPPYEVKVIKSSRFREVQGELRRYKLCVDGVRAAIDGGWYSPGWLATLAEAFHVDPARVERRLQRRSARVEEQ